LRFFGAAVVADKQAMLGRGGLAVQEIQIPSIITLTMMAAVRITEAVTEAEVVVVIIDLDMMSRPSNQSPEPTAVGYVGNPSHESAVAQLWSLGHFHPIP
jgi:hypothetical protein